MPKRGSPLSAGFDLASAEKTIVPAGGRAVVKTDLSIACPVGTYARIAPRSGLAVKKMIDCGAGVVDADYRGNVGVVLFNFGTEDFQVDIGDRIAQLILEQISMVPAVQVDELTETERGAGGFGSTGVKGELSEPLQKIPRVEDVDSTRKIMTDATPTTDCLQLKFLSDQATMPTKGSPLSAGFDLASAEKTVVPAGGRAVVKTDLSIACPVGTYARIAPRSGLAVKKMIDCGAGVVDADYRGNVGVVLFNFGTEDFEIDVGDRIAQLILEQISMVPAMKVAELTETERGAGGFGSTGVKEDLRDPFPKVEDVQGSPETTVSMDRFEEKKDD